MSGINLEQLARTCAAEGSRVHADEHRRQKEITGRHKLVVKLYPRLYRRVKAHAGSGEWSQCAPHANTIKINDLNALSMQCWIKATFSIACMPKRHGHLVLAFAR